MNLRPPGYEPGELPDCSTPRRERKDSIPRVPWWTWIALAAFGLAILGSGLFGVWASGRMKVLFASSEVLAARMEELSRRNAELQRRSERASLRTQELQLRIDRVNRSLAQLGVLGWALGDTRRSLMRLRRSYLRK